MTYPEMERTMQFILETQAQLTANVQKHDENIAHIEAAIRRHDEQIGELTGQVGELTGQVGQLTGQVQTAADLVGRLARSEIALTERFQAQMAELSAAGRDTEERLNALITLVEKYISRRDGNGKMQ